MKIAAAALPSEKKLSAMQDETPKSGGNHAGGSATEAQEPRPARRAVAARPRKLGELFGGTGVALPAGSAEIEVRQIACDSRKVLPRSLFFALHGAKADGNEFARDAVGRGAIVIASANSAEASPAVQSLAQSAKISYADRASNNIAPSAEPQEASTGLP